MPARTSLEWGGGVVGRVAPDVDARLARVCASIWYTPRSEITALMRLRAAQLLRIEDVAYWWTPGAPDIDEDRRADLSTWPTSAVFSDAERACLDFTEQFVIDVSAITRSQRDAVSRHAGSENLLTLVISLFVVDYELRCGLVFDRLFPTAGRPGRGAANQCASTASSPPASGRLVGGDALMTELDEVLRAVARFDHLDPVTTELVRLRGARHHNCRLCRSIRSASAVREVGDEEWFERIEGYETSDLGDSQKVALRLADAVIGQPTEVDEALVSAVRSHFDESQAVELVLDVFRNSSQKIAVSLGADQPHVTAGTELFEVTAEGSLIFSG